ncbi:glycosyltransferase [Geodermatophilus sp. SYSU D01036]
MRIAVVYDCLYPWTTGGAERLFRSYAEEWVAQGHEVTYLTRRQWDAGEEPEVPGVRVRAIAGRVGLYDEGGSRRLGPALTFALAVAWYLLRHRRAHDVVYVSAIPPVNVPAARVALLGSRALLLTDWLEIWRPEQWREYSGAVAGRLAGLVQAVGIRMSRRSVCYSRLHARRLEALRHRGRLFIAPGLLPADERERTPGFDVPERPRLLFVGRHIPDKRVELVVEAVARLRAGGRDVSAVVTGDGPTREAVRRRAEELGVAGHCAFPGFVSQAELDRLMRASSCLVFPSVREGYGLVVVEAAAAATPAVVVDAPDNAAAELVTAGVNGAVAPEPEAGAVARAVATVLDGGEPLRRSTRRWFDESARHGTVRATAGGLLSALVD